MTDPVGTLAETSRERINRREAKAVSLGIELHSAAQSGDAAQIAVLVKHRASVSARLPNGWMPLHTAAHHGQASAIESLLSAGADPNALADRAATPLKLAQANGNAASIAALLQAGAETDGRPRFDGQGVTGRHAAITAPEAGIHRAGMQAQRTSGARA